MSGQTHKLAHTATAAVVSVSASVAVAVSVSCSFLLLVKLLDGAHLKDFEQHTHSTNLSKIFVYMYMRKLFNKLNAANERKREKKSK